ncbi:hypothetical protein IKE71_03975 [Candidatus Saccharibacteria bacterium]|nr:hypothetical protein [Candidatus Saccharibacteria bacterium]
MQIKLKPRILYHRLLGLSVGALAVFVLGFVAIPYVSTSANAVNRASVGVAWSSVSLTLDPDYDASNAAASWSAVGSNGHGDVNFGSFIPSSVGNDNIGTQKVVKKTIAVETTGRQYAVYLSTDDEANDLALSGGGTGIDAVNGTWTAPTVFSQKGWGYAVPDSPISGANFSAASVYSNYDSLIAADAQITASSSQYYNTGTWAAVPCLTSPQQIWKAETSNLHGFGGTDGDSTNDKFNIYYSAVVDTSLVSGEYAHNIIYTALASSSTIDTVSSNLSRTQEYVFSGDTETITFDLAMSTPTVTQDQIRVYLVPHSVTEANKRNGAYAETGLSDYKTSTYECPITSFSITDRKATLNCTIPDNPGGVANTTGGSTMAGEYDLYLTIDTYGYKYISQYTKNGSEVGTVMYAGLQSKKRNGSDSVITEMQEMTSSVCKNTNKWGATVGSSAIVYRYDGSTAISGVTTAPLSAAIGIGTFLLADNRDQKAYLIRRLADGNCWMVQNLDLNLASFAGTNSLTSDNTDLNSKSVWDPSARMRTKSSVLEAGSAGSLSVSDYQFQNRLSYGKGFMWLSICAAETGPLGGDGTIACETISGENNANTEYARSYDNGYTYLSGENRAKDPTKCINGEEEYCRMPGVVADLSGDSTLTIQATDGLTVDTILQPSLIENSSSDSYTMRGTKYFGDYYNWYAATAESGSRTDIAVEAADSICARGWKLSTAQEAIGSYIYLIKDVLGWVSGVRTNNKSAVVNMLQLPMSFSYTGYYSNGGGALNSRGYGESIWTSTSDASTGIAKSFHFNSGGSIMYYSDQKSIGLAVRCVARD